MADATRVTVGFTARERFSLGAKALTFLFNNTDLPFNLVVVDGNTPERYRREMDSVLRNRSNVQIIRRPDYLLPNAAKNLVLASSNDEFVCLIENDCLVQPGWLGHLVRACDETQSHLAVPKLFEGSSWRMAVHHDHHLGSIEFGGKSGRDSVRLVPAPASLSFVRRWRQRRLTQAFENHCLLLRREAVQRIHPLPEQLNTDEHIDLMLELARAGMKAVFEPAARINFHAPPPVQDDEKEFYRFRWNPTVAETGNKFVREKWNIQNMPRSYLFAHSQLHRTNLRDWIVYKAGTLFGKSG